MTGGQRSSDVVVPVGAVGRIQEGYAELCCRTNYSFLEGASHPDELVRRAADQSWHRVHPWAPDLYSSTCLCRDRGFCHWHSPVTGWAEEVPAIH